MGQAPSMSLVVGGYCSSSLLILTEQDASRVHPDDLAAVRANYPLGWQLLCFRYGGQDCGYDVLDDGQLQARVRGAVIRPIRTPRFQRGDRVFAHPNQAIGDVRQLCWHATRECVYYSLEFDGRRSGRWYFECDLSAADGAESGSAADPSG